ncbi:probable E3 ubiquitin-protein ligase ARI2 isoform X2 [Salvia miltiorrhiza]|uniref:probable E3 ubiquitin-protein ligase ARI2 isoform X2 n=1 Tax=Salvia miltiorrhiza TaxID=226208 RepID=UPI0025AD4145|nr:probable E3 ubiquitin-protein ligase ARI2 isoform X2 [Salvia miltiorrhiza]
MGLKVITRESLWAAQTVMELLSVREHHARTLLIHYRWDVEKLITAYFEKGESRMFTQVGVTRDELLVVTPPESSSTLLCHICTDDVSVNAVSTMDCGHCFCNTCWTEHFVVKINEGQSKRIRCMAHECNTVCDEAIVRSLVGTRHLDLAEKFDRILLESYIEDNKLVKWCPSTPHCGNAIQVENDEFCEVECSCGLQFCFSCSSEAHSPCSCSMWQLWTQKCRDESETVNWITVNTMPCPKCHKAVEKNGGCNLVRCVCGQSFCWLCGEATGYSHSWDSIEDHSCGRYKEDTNKKAEHAKRNLYRYVHYYNRYKAHTDSFKQESQLWEMIEDKVSNLQARDLKLRDFSWVANGFCRLLTSRRALSYSYPFAFYAFGDDFCEDEMTEKESGLKRHFFEDQQQQLESNVEKLSEILEEPIDEYADEEQVRRIRIQVIDLSVIADSLCRRMYECIENDLLGSLQYTVQIIAPYQSKGIEKAGELAVGRSSQGNDKEKCHKAADWSSGDAMEISQASTSGTSDESRLLSWKRPRHERSSSGSVSELCSQLLC